MKVASSQACKSVHEFAISFGKGIGIGEVSQVKYSCSARVGFCSVRFALRDRKSVV